MFSLKNIHKSAGINHTLQLFFIHLVCLLLTLLIDDRLMYLCKFLDVIAGPELFTTDLITLHPPEGGRGIEIGRSVSPPAGRTLAKGASVSSSEMYKYSNSPSRRLCRVKKSHQVSQSWRH